jgi:hypothetical protein
MYLTYIFLLLSFLAYNGVHDMFIE